MSCEQGPDSQNVLRPSCMNAVLALADGTILRGRGFGAEGSVTGELVFNTSMVGYEEALTDPSYCGQILLLTFPLIGNYGVRQAHFESESIQVEGFAIKHLSPSYSHRKAVRPLTEFMKEQGIPGISDFDTRFVTKKLRDHGIMNACLMAGEHEIDAKEALSRAKKAPDISSRNLLDMVSVKQPVLYDSRSEKTIAVIDLGIKHSILRYLGRQRINALLMPYTSSAQEILDAKPDAVLLSNGPGDPESATHAIKAAKELYGQLPLFGICLGHQVMGLAAGGVTSKLKFGHHGSNQPVKELTNGRVYITSQNHTYVIDEASCDGTGLMVTMRNLNDNSVEGVADERCAVHSVQFHPEANPGPMDVNYLFDDWIKLMKDYAKKK